MKKKIAAIVTAAGLMAAGTIYPTTCTVTNCDTTSDLVTMSTATGYLFQIEGVEDNWPGDLVSCIMFDSFTPNDITDDIILSYRYSGTTEQFNEIISK